MNFNTKLSKYFTYGEAIRYKAKNKPAKKQLVNMVHLCAFLDNIREVFGPTTMTSGFRNSYYNKKAGGASNSQHLLGEAADIWVKGVDMRTVFFYIYENLDYDQMIFEEVNGKIWIHVSWKLTGRRKSTLKYDGKAYKPFTGGAL